MRAADSRQLDLFGAGDGPAGAPAAAPAGRTPRPAIPPSAIPILPGPRPPAVSAFWLSATGAPALASAAYVQGSHAVQHMLNPDIEVHRLDMVPSVVLT